MSQANKRGRGKGKTSSEPEPKKHILSVPSSNNLRPLDSYYYGTKPGAAQILASQKHFDLNMKVSLRYNRLPRNYIWLRLEIVNHRRKQLVYIHLSMMNLISPRLMDHFIFISLYLSEFSCIFIFRFIFISTTMVRFLVSYINSVSSTEYL